MRRVAVILAAASLMGVAAVALAADRKADGDGGQAAAGEPPAPAQAQAQAPTAISSALAPLAAPAQDPAECRISCAQTYYVCRAADDEGDCESGWSRCVAACNSPELAAPAAGLPGA